MPNKTDTIHPNETLQILGNYIRKAIIESLYSNPGTKRFSELMQLSGLDPNSDSGHFFYHLQELLKNNYVKKESVGYSLTEKGFKLSKVLNAINRGASLNLDNGEINLDVNQWMAKEQWQRYLLPSMTAGWNRAEATVEGLVKILEENGVEDGKVLDLCCGNGRLSTWMAKKGFTVVGLDISKMHLEEAERKAKEHGVDSKVNFIHGDMRELDQVLKDEAPFDVVLNFKNSLGWWGDRVDEMVFTMARKLTTKGGVLVIGECDHTGNMMRAFGAQDMIEREDFIILRKSWIDYLTTTFNSTWRFYEKNGNDLKYFDHFDFQARVYTPSELASLLKRAGWETIEVYSNIATQEPFTEQTIYTGNRTMNLIAKAE